MITQSELKELLNYNQDTGVFSWKVKKRGTRGINNQAGHTRKNKYVVISINKKDYLAHRLAWLYVNGIFSKEYIDHIDNNPSNNAINNLRECSNAENQWNAGLNMKNTSGVKGVYFHNLTRKWRATLRINGKRKYFGGFNNLEQARDFIVDYRTKNHKEFSNHGLPLNEYPETGWGDSEERIENIGRNSNDGLHY